MSFFAVINKIPWALMLANAPQFLDRATDLVAKVRSSRPTLVVPVGEDDRTTLSDNVAQLEEAVLTLNRQLADATELLTNTIAGNRDLIIAGAVQRQISIALAAAVALSWIAILVILLR